MKRFGYMTVYLALTFGVLLSLLLAVIEGARRSTVRMHIECCADMALDSVLAQYHREMLNQYDLFFIDTSYGTGDPSFHRTEDWIFEYMEKNLRPGEEFSIPGARDITGLSAMDAELLRAGVATDDDGGVLKYHAVRYMKDISGISLAERILGLGREAQAWQGQDVEGRWDAAEEALKEEIARKKRLQDEEWDGEIPETPSDAVRATRGEGILGPAAQGMKLSGASIPDASRPSRRKLNRGTGLFEPKTPAEGLIEDGLFYAYIMEHCGYLGNEKENSALAYEVEYILQQQCQDRENLKRTARELLLIREAANCRQRFLDGETFLYYDISSRQPLERLYESTKMGVKDLAGILRSIAAMQEDLGEYLLDEQGLLLEAEMLFADVESEEIFFCYDPQRRTAGQRYAKLADFFLEHVDHSEEHAVNVAYQFYKLSKGEYFVLSSFLPYLEKEEAKARESAGEREEVPEDPFASGFAPEKEREAKGGAGGLSGSEWPEDARAEIERPPSKKSWLSRLLFGRRERHKKTAKEELPEEAWPDTVWDSYAGQLDPKGTGETVYFTDLERKQEGGKTACLEEEGGGRRFPLRELPMTVGKLKGRVSIELTDSSVSRIHARLLVSEGGIHVLDLNSRNGTIVNGRKLSPNESAAIREGDLVQFGRERFTLRFY